jgi:hypothetical protein
MDRLCGSSLWPPQAPPSQLQPDTHSRMEINFAENSVYTSYVVVYYQLITTPKFVTGKLSPRHPCAARGVHHAPQLLELHLERCQQRRCAQQRRRRRQQRRRQQQASSTIPQVDACNVRSSRRKFSTPACDRARVARFWVEPQEDWPLDFGKRVASPFHRRWCPAMFCVGY